MDKETLMKKSIFKQKVYRTVYEFVIETKENNICSYFVYSTKINSKFEKVINSEKEIFVCNLEIPMLETEEKFYIEEQNKTVIISERIRSSKENICYYVEPEYIEDDISLKSLEVAKLSQKDYLSNRLLYTKIFDEETKLLKIKINGLEKIISQYKTSFWYKFMNKVE